MSPADAVPPVLAVEGLRFRHPGAARDLLRLDRLHLAPASRLMVRGESGCGKSTLMALAAGVLLAGAGTVRLLGQDWRRLGAAARDARRVDHVGCIFQQFNLLPHLSVLQNVELPCLFSTRRAARARAAQGTVREAAQALLHALQLDPGLATRDAGTLSVGQQQRVAAARALIGQPELVVADEPTSALDEARRDAFMALLGAECARSGSALLFVSHDPRLAAHFPQVLELPAASGDGG